MERSEFRCDRLIDDIYDAGACPDRWPGTLSSVASAVGAKGAIMFGFSKTRGHVFEYNGALDDTCATIFKTRHANNVWVQAMARKPLNQVVLTESILKLRALKRTEFYDEVLRPQQIGHGALATLSFGTDLSIQFSLYKARTDNSFRPREEILLKRLVPHIRRAVGVSLRLERSASAAPESVIDRLTCAAFTLNRRGELVDANLNAQRLLAGEGPFMPTPGRIRSTQPDEQPRLLRAVKRVLDGAPLQTITLHERLRRFEVAITGLKACPVGVKTTPDAAAVLVLVCESFATGDERLTSLFAHGLTAAECRVAKVACLGVSNGEIAETLNVSANTVKTHLRRVYHKLNVRRQGELVFLMGQEALEDHPPG